MPLFKRAAQDNLTGLHNRESFELTARKVIARAESGDLSIAYLHLLNLGSYNVR